MGCLSFRIIMDDTFGIWGWEKGTGWPEFKDRAGGSCLRLQDGAGWGCLRLQLGAGWGCMKLHYTILYFCRWSEFS